MIRPLPTRRRTIISGRWLLAAAIAVVGLQATTALVEEVTLRHYLADRKPGAATGQGVSPTAPESGRVVRLAALRDIVGPGSPGR